VLSTVELPALERHSVRQVVLGSDHAQHLRSSKWSDLGAQLHLPCRQSLSLGNRSDVMHKAHPLRVHSKVFDPGKKPIGPTWSRQAAVNFHEVLSR
jgi:hypothetical protein